ncbi:MAG TPA: hypothetical protein VKT49_07310, partial [Bryobacteraceae bacterium]|nr:hypothetical protein [Bryobacteraceae bacterium]
MGARSVWFLLAATLFAQERLEDKFYIPLDDPAIHYAQPPDDPVARLEQRLESGKVKLEYNPNGPSYLASVLHELGVHIDSQVLVFSKTSIQLSKISPRTPRAIYFNDQVSVGFVQGGDVLELTALDPRQGIILYTLDTEKTDKPQFSRRDDCLKCHQGPVTLGVPGLLISSVHPRTEGRESHGSAYMTDHRSPLEERWGGWYVTGTSGDQKHLGNNPNLVDPLQPGGPAGPDSQNVTSLGGWFDTSRYLAPTSDLVALMTLEHQTRMTNLITRVGWDARINPKDHNLNSEIEEMLGYMLFTDEAPLKNPIAGVSTFTKTFPQRGPHDHEGRSLR